METGAVFGHVKANLQPVGKCILQVNHFLGGGGGGGAGGLSHIKMMAVLIIPFNKKSKFVLLRVLKSTMTTVRIIMVPFKTLSQHNLTEYDVLC